MDTISQLESELSVLDAPSKKAAPTAAREGHSASYEDNNETKLKAAETLAAALDNLSEYVEQTRVAAHSLVEALSPTDPTEHVLTVGETSEGPANLKECDDEEVPQES